MDRNAAFGVYKGGAGRAAAEELAAVKATLKGARLRVKAASESVNDLKLEIDTLGETLDTKRRARALEQSDQVRCVCSASCHAKCELTLVPMCNDLHFFLSPPGLWWRGRRGRGGIQAHALRA